MLPGSLALYLLLLAQTFPLTLLLHLLPDTLALGLGWNASRCRSLLLDLLPPQILHLLPCVTIAASRLSGQIGHLFFTRLFCGYVRLRTHLCAIARLRAIVNPLLIGRSSLIRDLKFLAPRSIGHWRHVESARQVSFKRLSRRRTGYDGCIENPLSNRLRYIESSLRVTSPERRFSQRIHS